MTGTMCDPALRVSHLADAADRLGCGNAAGASLPLWLGPRGQMVMGKACTVRQRAVDVASGMQEPAVRHGEVVKSVARPGEIVVIAVEGSTVGATWGEAHTLRALGRGLAGALIDGFTRDVDGLRERGFPVLCRGGSPFRSAGRLETVDVGVELQFMGITIRHGDTIAIDSDGFIRVAPQHTDAVIALAREIALKERQRDAELVDQLSTPTGPTQ